MIGYVNPQASVSSSTKWEQLLPLLPPVITERSNTLTDKKVIKSTIGDRYDYRHTRSLLLIRHCLVISACSSREHDIWGRGQ